MTHVWARPVFSGKTEDGEKIVLYQSAVSPTKELHIKRGEGEVQALNLVSPGSSIMVESNAVDAMLHVSIRSPEWTGKASGSTYDLLEEEALRR